jgi:hypothetical protein
MDDMRRLYPFLLLLLPVGVYAQVPIPCNATTLVACSPNTNTGTGTAGVPAWQGFGITNENFNTLAPLFSSANGTLFGFVGNKTQAITLGTNLALSGTTLNATGGSSGAPGIVYAANCPGVTLGSGPLTTPVQQANVAALQACIATAGANNETFDISDGNTYEIEGAALVIPYNNFNWRGSERSTIVQYSNNIPVVHIGQPLGNSNSTSRVTMDGAVLKYSGTGVAGANALELTGVWMAAFSNIDIGDVYAGVGSFVSIPYIGVYGDPSSSAPANFSNNFTNIRIKPWVNWAVNFDNVTNGSTGDVWTNLYTGAGSNGGGVLTVTGGSLYFNNYKNLTIRQWNAEWMNTPTVAHFEQVTGATVEGSNIEGITLSEPSSEPAFMFQIVGSRIAFAGMWNLYETFKAANNVSAAAVFGLGSCGCYLRIDDYHMEQTTKDSNTSPNLALIQNLDGGGDTNPEVDLGFFTTQTTTLINQIDNFTFSSGTGPVFTSLRMFNNWTPQALADANATIYVGGQAGVLTMAPTTARTLTLSNLYNAATAQAVGPRGVIRKIVCLAGSAGSIVVVNGGSNAGTLETLTCSGATNVTAADVLDGTGNWSYIGP